MHIFKKTTGAIALSILPLLSAASAQTELSGVDFILDWKSLVGKEIIIKDCVFLPFGGDQVFCYYGSTKENFKFMPNQAIIISVENMVRDDRRILLSGCGLLPRPTCFGNISGRVKDWLGQPSLEATSIVWKVKP